MASCTRPFPQACELCVRCSWRGVRYIETGLSVFISRVVRYDGDGARGEGTNGTASNVPNGIVPKLVAGPHLLPESALSERDAGDSGAESNVPTGSVLKPVVLHALARRDPDKSDLRGLLSVARRCGELTRRSPRLTQLELMSLRTGDGSTKSVCHLEWHKGGGSPKIRLLSNSTGPCGSRSCIDGGSTSARLRDSSSICAPCSQDRLAKSWTVDRISTRSF